MALPEEVSRIFHTGKDVYINISEINDGIYRLSGFVQRYGIMFNQFLIVDENPTLIHTAPSVCIRKLQRKLMRLFP